MTEEKPNNRESSGQNIQPYQGSTKSPARSQNLFIVGAVLVGLAACLIGGFVGTGLTYLYRLDAQAAADQASPSMAAPTRRATIVMLPTMTPTMTPSPTPSPSAVPTDTPAPPPTDTPVPTQPPTDEKPTEEPEEEQPPEEAAPTPEPVGTPTPVPAEPTVPPEPTEAPEPETAYKIVHYKVLGENENNGGIFNAGGQHLIFATVLDAAGNGVDGAVIKDANGSALEIVTGDKGPGKAEITMELEPFKLYVAADPGGPTTSEVSNQMNTAYPHVPDVIGKLGSLENEYSVCPTQDVRCTPPFYNVHFSYEITFQKVD